MNLSYCGKGFKRFGGGVLYQTKAKYDIFKTILEINYIKSILYGSKLKIYAEICVVNISLSTLTMDFLSQV